MLFLIVLLLSVLSISQCAVLPQPEPLDFEPRIINGINVAAGEIPYQVSLQLKVTNGHFCGGSIYNKNYVITAAHCIDGISATRIQIVAGTVNLNKPQMNRTAKAIIKHKRYNVSDSWRNDIALIKVNKPFIFSRNVSAVKMPIQNEIVKIGALATVSGFGTLRAGGPASVVLKKANIYIAKQDVCNKKYNFIGKHVYSTNLCANDPKTEKGSCQGDSGGPLTIKGKLVGIVSWARGCALRDYPSVYTRVSSYVTWIKQNAK